MMILFRIDEPRCVLPVPVRPTRSKFRKRVAKFEAGELKKDYFFVGSQKECEEIVESNKALYSSRMGANS